MRLIILSIMAVALNANEPNLNTMAENFDEYKDKEIVINLRFKNMDQLSQYMVFYDMRNRDITFDYSKNRSVKNLIKQNPSLRRGLIYKVKLIPRDIDEFFNIKADLLDYEPLFLEKLPYKKAE